MISDAMKVRLRPGERFRAAIEACRPEMLPVGLQTFPHGACGDATLLLAKYLERNGHTGFIYVLGMRGERSHAWLRRGELLIDITPDQFEEQDEAVIVGCDSVWHSTFTKKDEHHADFEKYNEFTAASLARAYQVILQALNAK